MLEGFKINCFPLNRAIRISVALPKDYNNTTRFYPVIYFLDGQNLYKDSDSYRGVSLELDQCIEKLSNEGKEAIYIGIAAANNPEKRDIEYQEDILSTFIIQSIHPYLSSRYRMNQYIYAFACSTACYTALSLVQSDIFKGIILFSPLIKDANKIETLSVQPNLLVYIDTGETEEKGLCLKQARMLQQLLPSSKIVLDQRTQHDESAWKSRVYDALNYIVL